MFFHIVISFVSAIENPFTMLIKRNQLELGIPIEDLKDDICQFISWANDSGKNISEKNKSILEEIKYKYSSQIARCNGDQCNSGCSKPLSSGEDCLNPICKVSKSAFENPEIVKRFKKKPYKTNSENFEKNGIVVLTSSSGNLEQDKNLCDTDPCDQKKDESFNKEYQFNEIKNTCDTNPCSDQVNKEDQSLGSEQFTFIDQPIKIEQLSSAENCDQEISSFQNENPRNRNPNYVINPVRIQEPNLFKRQFYLPRKIFKKVPIPKKSNLIDPCLNNSEFCNPIKPLYSNPISSNPIGSNPISNNSISYNNPMSPIPFNNPLCSNPISFNNNMPFNNPMSGNKVIQPTPIGNPMLFNNSVSKKQPRNQHIRVIKASDYLNQMLMRNRKLPLIKNSNFKTFKTKAKPVLLVTVTQTVTRQVPPIEIIKTIPISYPVKVAPMTQTIIRKIPQIFTQNVYVPTIKKSTVVVTQFIKTPVNLTKSITFYPPQITKTFISPVQIKVPVTRTVFSTQTIIVPQSIVSKILNSDATSKSTCAVGNSIVNSSMKNCLISNTVNISNIVKETAKESKNSINKECTISNTVNTSNIVNTTSDINKNTSKDCPISNTGNISNIVNPASEINKSANSSCKVSSTSISSNSTNNTDSQTSKGSKTSTDKILTETITKTILESKTPSSSEITVTKYIIQEKLSTNDKGLPGSTKLRNQEKFRRGGIEGMSIDKNENSTDLELANKDFNIEEVPLVYRDLNGYVMPISRNDQFIYKIPRDRNEYSTDYELERANSDFIVDNKDLNKDKTSRYRGYRNFDIEDIPRSRDETNSRSYIPLRPSKDLNTYNMPRDRNETNSFIYDYPRPNKDLNTYNTPITRNKTKSFIYNSPRSNKNFNIEEPVRTIDYSIDDERINSKQTSTEPEITIFKEEREPKVEDFDLRTMPVSSKVKRLTVFKDTGTGDRTIKLDMDEIRREENLKSLISDQLENQIRKEGLNKSFAYDKSSSEFNPSFNKSINYKENSTRNFQLRNSNSRNSINSYKNRSSRGAEFNPNFNKSIQNIPLHNSQNLDDLISKFRELTDSILLKNLSTQRSQFPVSVVSTKTIFTSTTQSTKSKTASSTYKELEKLEKNFKEESLKNRALIERVLEKLENKNSSIDMPVQKSISEDIPLYPNELINEILESSTDQPIGGEKKQMAVIFPDSDTNMTFTKTVTEKSDCSGSIKCTSKSTSKIMSVRDNNGILTTTILNDLPSLNSTIRDNTSNNNILNNRTTINNTSVNDTFPRRDNTLNTTRIDEVSSTSNKTSNTSTINCNTLFTKKSDKITTVIEHSKNPLLELLNLISPKEDRSFLFDFLNFNKKPVDDTSKTEKELKDKLIHELLVFINKDARDEEDILNILRLIKMVKEERKNVPLESQENKEFSQSATKKIFTLADTVTVSKTSWNMSSTSTHWVTTTITSTISNRQPRKIPAVITILSDENEPVDSSIYNSNVSSRSINQPDVFVSSAIEMPSSSSVSIKSIGLESSSSRVQPVNQIFKSTGHQADSSINQIGLSSSRIQQVDSSASHSILSDSPITSVSFTIPSVLSTNQLKTIFHLNSISFSKSVKSTVPVDSHLSSYDETSTQAISSITVSTTNTVTSTREITVSTTSTRKITISTVTTVTKTVSNIKTVTAGVTVIEEAKVPARGPETLVILPENTVQDDFPTLEDPQNLSENKTIVIRRQVSDKKSKRNFKKDKNSNSVKIFELPENTKTIESTEDKKVIEFDQPNES